MNNKRKPVPSWEILEKYFIYDETSPSCLRWKIRKCNSVRIGDVVGWRHYNSRGNCYYWATEINNTPYQIHNLIWMMLNHEDVPEGMTINHIDNDTENNKIQNLNPELHTIQTYNRRLQKSNSSGVRGVHWRSSNGRWIAAIREDGKQRHLGQSANIEDAIVLRIKYMLENRTEIAYKNEIQDLKKNFPEIYLKFFPTDL